MKKQIDVFKIIKEERQKWLEYVPSKENPFTRGAIKALHLLEKRLRDEEKKSKEL